MPYWLRLAAWKGCVDTWVSQHFVRLGTDTLVELLVNLSTLVAEHLTVLGPLPWTFKLLFGICSLCSSLWSTSALALPAGVCLRLASGRRALPCGWPGDPLKGCLLHPRLLVVVDLLQTSTTLPETPTSLCFLEHHQTTRTEGWFARNWWMASRDPPELCEEGLPHPGS